MLHMLIADLFSLFISLVMTGFGVVTVCTALTTNYAGIITCRLMLGIFESGELAPQPAFWEHAGLPKTFRDRPISWCDLHPVFLVL